jgi:hypothetical protein
MTNITIETQSKYHPGQSANITDSYHGGFNATIILDGMRLYHREFKTLAAATEWAEAHLEMDSLIAKNARSVNVGRPVNKAPL